jgi:hypothetical protein
MIDHWGLGVDLILADKAGMEENEALYYCTASPEKGKAIG